MFGGIKKRWAEARGNEILKQVIDIVQRFNRMNSDDQYLVTSAFQTIIMSVERDGSELSDLSDNQKRSLAGEVFIAARSAAMPRGSSMGELMGAVGANGGALFSFYLEAQTLPGDGAKLAVGIVDEWKQSWESK